MLMRVGSFVALILVATLVLAACGKPDDEVPPTVTRIPVDNAPVPPTATIPGEVASPVPSGDGGGETPSGSSGMQTTFDIAMLDVSFDITELTVPANTEITINLVNNGALTHTFDIDELGVVSGEYASGQTGSVTFNSGAPAEYEFYCAIPGHREIGMVGKIKVVEESGGAAPVASAEPSTDDGLTSPAGGPVTFDIEMKDVSFAQTELTVPANTDVTINLLNSGALPHTFDIDELGVHSGDYASGQTGTVTFNSGAPGEYEFYCAVPGHRESGMVGKLIVTGDAAPADDGVERTPPPVEASPVASPVALQTIFDVVLEDIKYDVTELQVPANTEITINLVNNGALPHNFSIPELGVNSGDYVSGQTGTLTFNSGAPAQYQYFCDVPGHKDIGMVGNLTVVDAAAGGGGETAGANGGSGSAGVATTFDIQLLDIQFDVAEITVPANTEITINLTNGGLGPHTFDIDELGVKSGELAPGESKTVTFNSGAPGSYEFYCAIAGHRQIGMVGRIIVQ